MSNLNVFVRWMLNTWAWLLSVSNSSSKLSWGQNDGMFLLSLMWTPNHFQLIQISVMLRIIWSYNRFFKCNWFKITPSFFVRVFHFKPFPIFIQLQHSNLKNRYLPSKAGKRYRSMGYVKHYFLRPKTSYLLVTKVGLCKRWKSLMSPNTDLKQKF